MIKIFQSKKQLKSNPKLKYKPLQARISINNAIEGTE